MTAIPLRGLVLRQAGREMEGRSKALFRVCPWTDIAPSLLDVSSGMLPGVMLSQTAFSLST